MQTSLDLKWIPTPTQHFTSSIPPPPKEFITLPIWLWKQKTNRLISKKKFSAISQQHKESWKTKSFWMWMTGKLISYPESDLLPYCLTAQSQHPYVYISPTEVNRTTSKTESHHVLIHGNLYITINVPYSVSILTLNAQLLCILHFPQVLRRVCCFILILLVTPPS